MWILFNNNWRRLNYIKYYGNNKFIFNRAKKFSCVNPYENINIFKKKEKIYIILIILVNMRYSLGNNWRKEKKNKIYHLVNIQIIK